MATPWSLDETLALCTHYPQGGYALVMQHLPGRTREAIENRARELELRSEAPPPHALLDEDILRGLRRFKYPGAHLEEVAAQLGVQPRTLRDRARKLGIQFETDRWSEEELQILRTEYPKGGVHACAGAGLERDGMSIRNKARRLGIAAPPSAKAVASHRSTNPLWQEWEIEILKAQFPSGGADACIAAGLQREASAIKDKAQRLQVVFERL
jgi:hypothetical protein